MKQQISLNQNFKVATLINLELISLQNQKNGILEETKVLKLP
jgi:hypothetical protein